MKETTVMDKIVESMMEHVCDDICRYPKEAAEQEELDVTCADCEMGQYVCEILNTYNRLNDFEKTQCADLLARLGAEQAKHRWIPVDERLPEVGERVLITTGDNDVDVDFLENPGVWF